MTQGGNAKPGSAEALQGEAEALAQALPPLLVEAEQLAASLSLGVHGRRKSGMGENFWQFRRYQPEDAASSIDWRQSAKSQHLYVREREWEAAEAVWFFCAGGAGMDYASAPGLATKRLRAALLLLALGSLLIRGGERIALLGDGEGPGLGKAVLRRMAGSLTRGAPISLPPEAPVTRNAQFVWFSDFLDAPEAVEATLKRLQLAGLAGHLVHIADPAEADFPFTGRTRFEANSEFELLGRAESRAGAYRARFAAHGAALRDLARLHGWSYTQHRTDKSAESALFALFGLLSGESAAMKEA